MQYTEGNSFLNTWNSQEVRRLWTYIDQQVCAQDELDMCKIRLQIKAPNSENKSKPTRTDMILKQLTYVQENHLENIHMIDEHEVSLSNKLNAKSQILHRNIFKLN